MPTVLRLLTALTALSTFTALVRPRGRHHAGRVPALAFDLRRRG